MRHEPTAHHAAANDVDAYLGATAIAEATPALKVWLL